MTPSLFDSMTPVGEFSEKPAKEKNHAEGHRQRMREKLIKNGGEGFADYEVLELLLTLAIPRKDVKPLAKDLLKRFGNFADVVNAGFYDLTKVPGVKEGTAALFLTVREACLRSLRAEVNKKPVLSSWDALIDYLRMACGFSKIEELRVLFLDSKNRLIADEVSQKGTINHTQVYPSELAKRALDLRTKSVIMVHNHPSGDVRPSRPDIEMTALVRDALEAVEVTLFDHLIISRKNHYSFKEQGML